MVRPKRVPVVRGLKKNGPTESDQRCEAMAPVIRRPVDREKADREWAVLVAASVALVDQMVILAAPEVPAAHAPDFRGGQQVAVPAGQGSALRWIGSN